MENNANIMLKVWGVDINHPQFPAAEELILWLAMLILYAQWTVFI